MCFTSNNVLRSIQSKLKENIMPTVSVTLPKDSWSEQEKSQLIDSITQLIATKTVEFGKMPSIEAITPFVAVHIHETAKGGYASGGTIFG
jgi:phenylpyruvate tautomerase PptA (4-oxalocrotonate tautomerase family)